MDPRPKARPEDRIRAIFDRVARRYDLLNEVLSLGQVRRWRRIAATHLRPRPGSLILDLGCGTGGLGGELASSSRVFGVDLSLEMLRMARRRLGAGARLVQASAFRLPFPDGAFAGAASAFVLRNLEDLPAALTELARVLAPGAPIALLDITRPPGRLYRKLFGLYFQAAAPALGALAGNRRDYRYLVGSVAHLPPSPELCSMLEHAGFPGAAARPLSGGAVTLFTATRGPLAADPP